MYGEATANGKRQISAAGRKRIAAAQKALAVRLGQLHEWSRFDRPTPVGSSRDCGCFFSVVLSDLPDHQPDWWLALFGEGISYAATVQRKKMENGERADAVGDNLPGRTHDWEQSGRSVPRHDVSVSLRALPAADSMERDYCAKK